MGFSPSSLLFAVADWLTPPSGRHGRRYWVGHGRAHIEVKGVQRPENADYARHMENEIARLEGVQWAEVNAALGRVIVAFDDNQLKVDDLVEAIEGVEDAQGMAAERFPADRPDHPADAEALRRQVYAIDDKQLKVDDLLEAIEGVEDAQGMAAERFPADRPDHPADAEALRRQVYAIGAEITGLGLALAGRAIRANPVLSEVASTISLADATPMVRRRLESQFGHAVTDLGLAVGSAVAQGLAQGPFGLLVDIAHHGLRLGEQRATFEAWQQREPELHERHGGDRLPALSGAPRPAPLPPGSVESYADRAAAAGLAVAVPTGALTRDFQTMVAVTATATPKAARLGREGFASWLGRDLAHFGVLAMDVEALRRLDRVDVVVLDAAVLTTGRAVLGTVWLPPGAKHDADRVRVHAEDLFDPANLAAHARRGRWTLAPAGHKVSGAARKAVRRLGAPGRRVLALRRDGKLLGLVVTEPELDPRAMALVSVARLVGPVIVAGRRSGVGEKVHADRVVPAGKRLAKSVRALQSDGHMVAVVSSRRHEALAAADVGIGIPSGTRPPWGAHLITGAGLADAYRILEAIPVAHAVSRRAAMLAAYGTGVGALLALSGPRASRGRRALIGVNGASLAALASGAWTARTQARREPPVPTPVTRWHALDPNTVLAELESSPQGLDDAEANRRQASQSASGEPGEPGVLRSSVEELANPLTPALASGAGMSAAIGSVSDAALIGAVMLANALVSGVQRVGAHRALRRLVDESAIRVLLRRSGAEDHTTADRLVVGDVITLQAGDAVPADCRVLDANGVEADESSLTGESQLVPKSAEPTGAASVAERSSMLYAGTAVATGTATAVVVAVGPATELGRSAEAGRGRRRPSGVQERLSKLTRTTVPISLGAGAAVIGGGLLRGQSVSQSLGTGVSLGVAAVPEGLPIVATMAELSTARRLSQRNALVRNPGTVEALGRVDVLCFDKTGTLTEGRIALHSVWADGGSQPEPVGALSPQGSEVLAAALRGSPEHRNGEPMAHPTDRAVVTGAASAGVTVELGTGGWHQVAELPFESSRGYHAVLGQTMSGYRIAVKGAPETVLPLCSHATRAGETVPLGEPDRQALRGQAMQLAENGYRVLAVAEGDVPGGRDIGPDDVRKLRLAGLLAFTDPIRNSAVRAVHGLRDAGVEMLMLTGDHPSTAEAIAADLGLLGARRVLTGPELDELSDSGLEQVIVDVGVFARVTPEQKVRIVGALQRAGRVVALTGDGANDAPAIRLADVGVALGRRGTNAAKEAADVIVTDDQIETIVDAIVEGRAMWASVRDAISVLLGGNLGEIAFTLGAGLLLPGGSPLNARQILLVNLLTDMAPSMALAVRPPGAATLKSLLAEGPDVSLGSALTRDVLVRGVVTSGAGAAAWLAGRVTGITAGRAGTVALIGIVGAQLGQTLLAGWRSPPVIAASLGSAAVLAAVIQTPGVSHFFGCRPLGPLGWGIGLAVATCATVLAPVLAGAVSADSAEKLTRFLASHARPRGT